MKLGTKESNSQGGEGMIIEGRYISIETVCADFLKLYRKLNSKLERVKFKLDFFKTLRRLNKELKDD